MKIVFFGTSEVGLPILQELQKEHEIVLVVTSPDAPVGRKRIITPSPIADFAVQNNFKIEKPEKVKSNPEFLAHLKTFDADIFVVVSYGKILQQELLNIPRLKTVNVHFSLLPKYRGAAPIQYALLNGETTTGTSIFILDELVDHGPILKQEKITVEDTDTFVTLADKLSHISAELINPTLSNYDSGKILPQEQNHDEATFAKLIKKEDGLVDWNKSATEIYNQWQAYISWPGIYTYWNDKKLAILECKPVTPEDFQSKSDLQKKAIVPCANNSFLELQTIQLEGKTPTKIADFLRGNPDFKTS